MCDFGDNGRTNSFTLIEETVALAFGGGQGKKVKSQKVRMETGKHQELDDLYMQRVSVTTTSDKHKWMERWIGG